AGDAGARTDLGDVAGPGDRTARGTAVARSVLTALQHAALHRAGVAVVAVGRGHAALAAWNRRVHTSLRVLAAVAGAGVAVVAVRGLPRRADSTLTRLCPVAGIRIGAEGAVRDGAVGGAGGRAAGAALGGIAGVRRRAAHRARGDE